jgi:hypothetical protein
MNAAWDGLTDPLRDAFETANGCCGFNDTRDRTVCSEAKIANSVSCSVVTTDRQENLFQWISASLFVFALITFVSYLLAHSLFKQYQKARKQFRLREIERKRDLTNDVSKTGEIRKKYAANEDSEKSIAKTSSMKSGSTDSKTPKFLPAFFKPTPKPEIKTDPTESAPRSSGTLLTYDEIASKYRGQT